MFSTQYAYKYRCIVEKSNENFLQQFIPIDLDNSKLYYNYN